tara:strand:- start:1283 stop:2572 length:1290 start_codon:yes stop_codon:yes gene_type:complete
MRWIGQHIWNFISRFRSDVYLDDISDGTVADDKFLGLDANNKIVKEAIAAGLNLANEGNNRVVTSSGGTDLNAESSFTWDGQDLNVTSGGTVKPDITFQATAPNNKPARLSFYKDRVGTTNDFVGQISFDGKDNGSASQQYGVIEASIVNATHTDEAGKIEIKVASSNGTAPNQRLFISGTGSNSADDVDVSIGYGSTSETTVAGSLTTEGGIFINNDSYLNLVNSGGYGVRMNYTNGTANRTVTFPDAAGTVQLQGASTGQIINVSLMKDDNYVLYLNTRTYWYSTAGSTYTGNTNVSAGNWSSWSDDRQARHCGYIASQACKVNKVRFVGLFSTSYTSGALDFEFALMKWTPGNDTTATVTTTYMTHTDHDGSYTEGRIYNLEFDVSGNNTLAAGDAFTLFARCVDSNASARLQLWYGNCWAEVELT